MRLWRYLATDDGKRILTFVGIFLINQSGDLSGIFGNLMTYTDSYLKYHVGVDPGNCAGITAGIFETFWSISFALSRRAFRCLSDRALCTVAVLLLDVSLFVGFFSVRTSVTAIALNLGVLSGVAYGTRSAVFLTLVSKWAPSRHVGIISALVTNTGFGAIFVNILITHYINPGNLKATESVGDRQFFSQTEVLERVPSIFLVIGGITVCIHAIGLCLVRNKEILALDRGEEKSGTSTALVDKSNHGRVEYTILVSEEGKRPESFTRKTENCVLLDNEEAVTKAKGQYTENHVTSTLSIKESSSLVSNDIYHDMFDSESVALTHIEKEKHCIHLEDLMITKSDEKASDLRLHSEWSFKQSKSAMPSDNGEAAVENLDKIALSEEKKLSYRELLKRKDFIAFWIGTGFGTVAYTSLQTYYKMFAQSRLTNDRFFGIVAPIMQLFFVMGKLGSGALVDRLGVKSGVVIYLASTSISMSSLYFAPSFGELPYLCNVCFCALVSVMCYGLYPAAVLVSFESCHVSTVYGLSTTAVFIQSSFFPLVTGLAIQYLGWWAVFQFGALVTLVALLVSICLLPDKT